MKDATDGRATALACSRAVRMAPQLSRCHPAAAGALLGLQPGVISQTPNKRKLLNAFFGASVRPFAGRLANAPVLPAKHPRGVAPGATKPAVLVFIERPDAT